MDKRGGKTLLGLYYFCPVVSSDDDTPEVVRPNVLTCFGTQRVALCVVHVSELLVPPDQLLSGALRGEVALLQAPLQLLQGQQVVHQLGQRAPGLAKRAAT